MRPGPPPRGALLLVCTLAFAIAALAGCGGGSRSESHAGPSPRATPPEKLCEQLISHWARVVLDGGKSANLDYQAMGLSGGQNQILLDVTAAARAEQRRQGADAARKLIDSQAAARCAERYRGGTPTGGPWQ
ncbi:hypothetical protein FBY35_5299 [Streptomyces sp. SLBN-118]|uniref:hypothetical protein n=1 Tax=Streptomyces sp. SLBN-118 TaxID=2768454 RepID=UPI001150ECAD|nr:hypothetical protein [Streptomyces sp. SLBN-118]TQK43823.1 hypothetical protein FBY35_5299 [Streptomyces sp. SLBN-118]